VVINCCENVDISRCGEHRPIGEVDEVDGVDEVDVDGET
jgi:hypothetical protein